MGSIGLPLEDGSEPLWKDLQGALNRSLRELFLQGIKQHLSNPAITIDDDKMHYAADPKAPTDGLKLTQHVKDNRKGFVDNHIVLTASQGHCLALILRQSVMKIRIHQRLVSSRVSCVQVRAARLYQISPDIVSLQIDSTGRSSLSRISFLPVEWTLKPQPINEIQTLDSHTIKRSPRRIKDGTYHFKDRR
jgi:hypothetical protein